tara:strand:- start:1018 stop:1611 length:594 start_codon:yes stop_codon:yes gene_type:complete
MFTGLIEEVGRVKKIESIEMDIRLCIETRERFLEGVALGESIAVSGVCLTVTDVSSSFFWADVSVETLKTTTIGFWQIGYEVNLERSLTPESRMGGHIVTGHIDGVGELVKRDEEGRSWRFLFRAPLDLSRYVARKGSICIDGTSLTVNSVIDSNFEVNIIPKTMDCTIFSNYIKGSMVNLEVDLIARYLERLFSDG